MRPEMETRKMPTFYAYEIYMYSVVNGEVIGKVCLCMSFGKSSPLFYIPTSSDITLQTKENNLEYVEREKKNTLDLHVRSTTCIRAKMYSAICAIMG